ncbi:MAG: hypothetical protein AAGA48_06215 [Myxococcota bacterium]
MATINFGNREITSKIVYFGASGAGCNSNVERLWHLVQSKRKSPLHRFGPKERQEESWYFDFVPLVEPPIEGFSMSWRIYSLPGGIDVKVHRDEVIGGVDAVVFVGDARADRAETNLDHILQLEALLKSIGLELSATPVVIQVNQTDAVDARPVDEVVADLNPFNFPIVPAATKTGEGVLETFAQTASAVLARVRDTLSGQDAITLTAVNDTRSRSGIEVIRRHMENIQARTETTPHSVTVDPPDRRPTAGAPSIEIPFQPDEFVGSHPLRITHSNVEGDRIRIDLDMQRMGGGEERQLTVWLVNRPIASLPLPPPVPPGPAPEEGRVFDYLPEDDKVEITEPGADLPGLVYGMLGIFGGIWIGLLSSYLLGFSG